jgi:hypothetical protein
MDGKNMYWQDLNIEIKRKLSKKWSITASYYNIHLNNDVIKITQACRNHYFAHRVIETLYKINTKHSIRAEVQGLWTQEEKIVAIGPHCCLNIPFHQVGSSVLWGNGTTVTPIRTYARSTPLVL